MRESKVGSLKDGISSITAIPEVELCLLRLSEGTNRLEVHLKLDLLLDNESLIQQVQDLLEGIGECFQEDKVIGFVFVIPEDDLTTDYVPTGGYISLYKKEYPQVRTQDLPECGTLSASA